MNSESSEAASVYKNFLNCSEICVARHAVHVPARDAPDGRVAEEVEPAANDPKRFVTLRGGHNDAFLVSADIYRGALADFVQSLPASS
jgi:hypothetical protein